MEACTQLSLAMIIYRTRTCVAQLQGGLHREWLATLMNLKPTEARPVDTIASAICRMTVSLTSFFRRFQDDQPSIGVAGLTTAASAAAGSRTTCSCQARPMSLSILPVGENAADGLSSAFIALRFLAPS